MRLSSPLRRPLRDSDSDQLLHPGPTHAPLTAAPSARRTSICGCQPTTGGKPPTASRTSAGRQPTGWRGIVVVVELTALALLMSASTAHSEATHVVGSVDQVLTNTRTWLMGILASLATVFLTIGGVRYVMGGGEPGEIEKAKTAFKAAGIGYALAALAPLVVTVLQGIVGA